MPRAALKATITTEVRTTQKISARAQKMLRERCEESVQLNRKAAEIKARKQRLGDEVEEIMKKEKLTGQLLDGFEFEGYPIKLVAGMTSKWDKKRMIADGIDPDAYIDKVPKKAYVRIGKGHDDE